MTAKSSDQTIADLKADPALASLRRSLQIYYDDPARAAAMDASYARFIRPGDLAFDIGAHVGDRVASFRRLGARVVAVEPQADCVHVMRALHGSDRNVELLEAACGPRAGMTTLLINSANPTVTTASPEFVRAAAGARGWEGQIWDRRAEVPITTLDALIATHGVPRFAKIDVEGYEHEVLLGLSRPLAALSFEFTTIQRSMAHRCIERLAQLGDYRFNVSLGESHALTFERWLTAAQMAEHVDALDHDANSGDIYARLA